MFGVGTCARLGGTSPRPATPGPEAGGPHLPTALPGGWSGDAGPPADGGAEAADLADGLGNALEQVRVVVHQPACAVRAASFLIGEERQHHVTRRPAALPEPLADDPEDHGVHVLHVPGAAAPGPVVQPVPGH